MTVAEVDSVSGRLGDQRGFHTQKWCDSSFEKVWRYYTFILTKFNKLKV